MIKWNKHPARQNFLVKNLHWRCEEHVEWLIWDKVQTKGPVGECFSLNLNPISFFWEQMGGLKSPYREHVHVLAPPFPLLFIPRQTRARSVRQVAAWLRIPVQETSYRCRSLGWFLLLPSGPWRKHSAGRDSCSGVRSAGLGYLFGQRRHTQSEDAVWVR